MNQFQPECIGVAGVDRREEDTFNKTDGFTDGTPGKNVCYWKPFGKRSGEDDQSDALSGGKGSEEEQINRKSREAAELRGKAMQAREDDDSDRAIKLEQVARKLNRDV